MISHHTQFSGTCPFFSPFFHLGNRGHWFSWCILDLCMTRPVFFVLLLIFGLFPAFWKSEQSYSEHFCLEHSCYTSSSVISSEWAWKLFACFSSCAKLFFQNDCPTSPAIYVFPGSVFFQHLVYLFWEGEGTFPNAKGWTNQYHTGWERCSQLSALHCECIAPFSFSVLDSHLSIQPLLGSGAPQHLQRREDGWSCWRENTYFSHGHPRTPYIVEERQWFPAFLTLTPVIEKA